MTHYIISINGRDYKNYTIKDINTTNIETEIAFDPSQLKLFNLDVFSYDNKQIKIIHSPIINNRNIPAVLILDNNKTYGRNSKTKQSKLLYKCVPNDVNIPTFLIPYEIKQIDFSKVKYNLYVTIQFTQWTDKHPQGIISQVIGNVDILHNFYEYQLYCKNLNHSITQFNKKTVYNVKNIINDNYEQFINFVLLKYNNSIQDRTHAEVFSIDPQSSKDFDDAFSISKLCNDQIILSIYIANVPILLDALQLWKEFSKRVSTIYLPDKKRPMLPNILSDNLCSLQANELRFAFTMDIIIQNDTIIDIKYYNTLIKVKHNFVYEEPKLLNYFNYKLLLDIASKISIKYNYNHSNNNNYNIYDSHQLVAYLMILMNHKCAHTLLKYNKGIFRHTIDLNDANDIIPDIIKPYISGTYVNINTFIGNTRHEMLQLDAYIHITSPIRRIVDLINIIQLQQSLQLITLSNDATIFFNYWIHQIEYINTNMKYIKKIQNDCNLLDMVSNNHSIINQSYEGYCFEKTIKSNGLYKYTVFLPELKITSNIILTQNFDNYEKHLFKLFIFNNEDKFKQKIKLSLL